MFDPTTRLNHTVTEIKPSGIRKFFDLLDEMKDVVYIIHFWDVRREPQRLADEIEKL